MNRETFGLSVKRAINARVKFGVNVSLSVKRGVKFFHCLIKEGNPSQISILSLRRENNIRSLLIMVK